jgi:hypothetical protein
MALQRKKQMDPNEVLKKVMDLNDSLWENSDTDDEDDGECVSKTIWIHLIGFKKLT